MVQVEKYLVILQQILIGIQPEAKLLALIKPGKMHKFYETMQLMAIAMRYFVRLFVQIPLTTQNQIPMSYIKLFQYLLFKRKFKILCK
jgi:hypothetical protein